MSKRSRIIGATIMTIMGALSITFSAVGGTDLRAAGLNEVGYDFTKIFIGAGVGLLTLSALFFVSASGD